MKALAIDIGAGTADFLLYQEGQAIENSIKLVLPSPPRYYAEQLRSATSKGLDVIISGYTIGGGPLMSKIKTHILRGFKVYMTPTAAYSIRNNLDQVRKIGVTIIDETEKFSGEPIFLDEIQLDKYDKFLRGFGETVKDVDFVALSVKDHGAPEEEISNREFRIRKYREFLLKNTSIDTFLFSTNDVPDYFIRMNSGISSVKSFLPNTPVYVMDTSPSAVRGCLEDENVKDHDNVLAVNVGNGHTMAAIIRDNQILGFFEHHTGGLTGKKLEDLIIGLAEGNITHKEIFEDGGHGAVILEDMPGFSNIDKIAVTGPRRGILKGSSIEYVQATPGGDVMMTGTIGILFSVLEKYY